MSRISKLSIWKCPKCKTFNEDYMDECECGFVNKYDKKKTENQKKRDEIDNYYFPDQEHFDGFY